MKVGIFGGSFDPVHLGHIHVAKFILAKELVDEVWMMPCYKSLYAKKTAAPEHRLRMVELTVEGKDNIEAFDFEIRHKLTLGTYDILQLIKKNYPDMEISFIIGQDNANKMTFWLNSEQIINDFSFIIFPRCGYPLFDDGWYMQPPHHFLTEGELDIPVSSTQIRRQFKNKSYPTGLEPEVYKYIMDYGLYQNKYY